jgi:hypothetical protein
MRRHLLTLAAALAVIASVFTAPAAAVDGEYQSGDQIAITVNYDKSVVSAGQTVDIDIENMASATMDTVTVTVPSSSSRTYYIDLADTALSPSAGEGITAVGSPSSVVRVEVSSVPIDGSQDLTVEDGQGVTTNITGDTGLSSSSTPMEVELSVYEGSTQLDSKVVSGIQAGETSYGEFSSLNLSSDSSTVTVVVDDVTAEDDVQLIEGLSGFSSSTISEAGGGGGGSNSSPSNSVIFGGIAVLVGVVLLTRE